MLTLLTSKYKLVLGSYKDTHICRLMSYRIPVAYVNKAICNPVSPNTRTILPRKQETANIEKSPVIFIKYEHTNQQTGRK